MGLMGLDRLSWLRLGLLAFLPACLPAELHIKPPVAPERDRRA